jgi:hypothetical protein
MNFGPRTLSFKAFDMPERERIDRAICRQSRCQVIEEPVGISLKQFPGFRSDTIYIKILAVLNLSISYTKKEKVSTLEYVQALI